MTEKPEKTEPPPPEKLLIDKPNDFQFHAAYLAYSTSFDRASNLEIKKQLNQSLNDLQENKIDYQTFYQNINRYRGEEGGRHDFGRSLIRTQKKKEWRRKTQKHERIERHRR